MLQIPTRLAALCSVVFALLCLYFGIDGFNSLADDPAQAAGERQFAWFWIFLGVFGLAMAWATWLVALKRERDGE